MIRRKQSKLNRIPKDVDPHKSGYEEPGQSRYVVHKRDGSDDGTEDYFVLRIDNRGDDPIWIQSCRDALKVLLQSLDTYDHLPALCNEIERRLTEYEHEADGLRINLQPGQDGKKKKK